MPDIPGNNSTTTSIAVGGTVTDSLEIAGDHDWIKINLTAGQSITVTVNGLSSGTGLTLEDPYLYIRGPGGDVLFEDDDIQDGVIRDSSVSFTANQSGTYYIDVGAWNEGYTGTYKVSVTNYTPPPLWTNDQVAYQLTTGFWGDGSHAFALNSARSISVNLSGLTPEGANLARTALAAWSEIIGVSFPEVMTGGQIIFDDNEEGANSTSDYAANGAITASHVNIETAWLTDYGTTVGTYSYQTYLHEIGHALGLGHAGNYNGEARYPFDALYKNDSWASSVMSYFSQTENTYTGGQGFTYEYLLTPMVADIIAIQQLYGSGSARTGNTTYGSGGTGIYVASNFTGPDSTALTIYDTGGIDTINFSNFSASQIINLSPESFSSVGGGRGNLAIARGTIIENAVSGSGNDTLIGNGAANVLTGGAGSDTLTGGGGSDTLDGSSGLDTASYSGLFRSYTTAFQTASGSVSGGIEGGKDTLISIENLNFKDGVLSYDLDGFAAQVTRLYDTVLRRAPDMGGLDRWVDLMESGAMTLKQVATGFLNSVEFQAKTGGLSNADFVEFLYNSALGRSSDPEGKAFWVNKLNTGSDRADILIGFSESQEHRALTASLTSSGYFNTDDVHQGISLLYDSMAGRLPDAAGLAHWVDLVHSGAMTFDQVADAFAASTEFQALTKGMTNGQLVDFMYHNTLDRGADPAGFAHWKQLLDNGMDRGDLLLGFSQSEEHFNLMASHITNGIDYLI